MKTESCKGGFMGGKDFWRPLASLASHGGSRTTICPDGRRGITAWRALVWAYADELVLAASNLGGGDGRPRLASSPMDRERIGGGTINGWYEPHADALLIHAKLSAWFHGDGEALARVTWHAERRRELPALVAEPRLRAVPVLDRNGNVLIERRRLGGRKGRVVSEFCLVDYEGLPPDVVEARERRYRAFHAMFTAFLDVMPGFPLQRWKISGRGLTDVGESLTR